MASKEEIPRDAIKLQSVNKILEKDRWDMTPYERGYLAGASNLMQGADRSEDRYYDGLSEEGRAAYDLGFYDGNGGLPLHGHSEEE